MRSAIDGAGGPTAPTRTASGLTDETPGQPDEELLRLIAGHDRDAFLALYRRYQDVVHQFAFHMSGNDTIAEDITQETFLALAGGARRFDASRAKFTTVSVRDGATSDAAPAASRARVRDAHRSERRSMESARAVGRAVDG